MRLCFFSFILFAGFTLQAQTKWHDPLKAGFAVIQNQGWTSETGQTYSRLPQRAKQIVRPVVWELSQNNAGLGIHFYTNAAKIIIRYQTTSKSYAMNHMPATGKSGIDLYAIDQDGKWRVATDKFDFSDTVTYTFNNLIQSTHKLGFEYRMFLPMYNTVKWLEIGIPDSAELKFIPVLKEKPVIVYGTSIAQGGCTSRPGMGWTNIVSRTLDMPVMNLAFSGNGPFEKEVVDLINEQHASLYIFDCLPNMGALSAEEVYNRVIYGVTKLRKEHLTPILLTDHIGYTNDETNATTRQAWQRLNIAQKRAYDTLEKRGTKNLFYLWKDSINFPADGCVDQVHPNDLGMQAYADAYVKNIRKILNMPVGSISTTKPVSQRREPNKYEWKERHAEILQTVKTNPPKAVIIGNSITHYWAGEPWSNFVNGKESWQKIMQPKGFYNLGFGWDRIENVLWRVYHGALDGYNAEKIVLMIGTNNIGTNTKDAEIVEGLQFLLKQIKIRQPKAKIKVMAILPRRNTEARIAALNQQIMKMVKAGGYEYADAGKFLLLPDKKIDESLFSDGLHPNEKGYMKIAETIAK